MANDAYLEALDDLAEAVRVHRDIYAANERGLLTWHMGCATTWKAIVDCARVAESVFNAGTETSAVAFTNKEQHAR